MFNAMEPGHRLLWGLVLAAGDGRRLERHVQELKGENLPKQYVNFVGRRSMLEHTFRRVEKLISTERVLTVTGEHHLCYREVQRQLHDRPQGTVIVQPENKETGAGILLPLMFLHKRCPEAIVAVFPSDHFILEEDRFMNYVHLAGQAIHHDPSRIVLLAVEAQEPEIEYGYIVPRERISGFYGFGTRRVAGFVEKPSARMALELMLAGALWNTMTMVFKLKTLLRLVSRFYPKMYLNFCRILQAIGTAEEQSTINKIYGLLEPVNFSKGLLEKIAARESDAILVLPVRRVYWSDWGSSERILRVMRTLSQAGSDRGPFHRRVEGGGEKARGKRTSHPFGRSTVAGEA